MIALGSNEIASAYVGGNAVVAMYLGSTLVFGEGSPSPLYGLSDDGEGGWEWSDTPEYGFRDREGGGWEPCDIADAQYLLNGEWVWVEMAFFGLDEGGEWALGAPYGLSDSGGGWDWSADPDYVLNSEGQWVAAT